MCFIILKLEILRKKLITWPFVSVAKAKKHKISRILEIDEEGFQNVF